MERKKIAIIGVGLIGGSLAIQLHEKKLSSHLIGVESSPEHAAQALELELVDEVLPLEEAIAAADVVILAIPVDSMVSLLPSVLDKIDRQIVLDLGSTKSQLVEVISQHPKRGRFCATHPMWGTEYSGPSAAVKGAYENKAVILCNPEQTDEDVLEWVKHMFTKIGMRQLVMEAKAHDLHAAYVSHISHITSFALANTVLEKEKEENAIFELASAGFESTVRLAKSNGDTWAPIFVENSEYILEAIDTYIEKMEIFRKMIAAKDEAGLKSIMEEANKIRKILN